ncbi:MAG: TolC family protein [Bryobacteraceae bacterium]
MKALVVEDEPKSVAYLRQAARIAALIAAVALSGCIKYHARPLDPPRSEQQFRTRTLADAGLAAFLKRADWPPSQLGLNDLTAVAFYFNADLDVARAQYRTAQAGLLTATARPNPSLSLGSGWTNSPESAVVFHFDLAITLETAGKRGWRILESEKLAEAARVQVDETAWRVRSRVRAAWLDYVIALRALDVLRNERDVRAEAVALLEKRLSSGEAARSDVSVARTALISVEAQAREAETTVAESGAALASAIGLPSLPQVDAQALPATPASLPLAEVQKAGLLHRADIRRSLLEYAAAEARLRLEIANQYPDIQLTPGYGFDEGHHKIEFSPSFPIPLFNRNRGPIAEAEARRAEAEARFNSLQAQAIGEMEIALARYHGGLAELAGAVERLTRIQRERETAMRRAVEAGEEDRLALAEVRLESAVAARARLEAMRRVQNALGALEDAVQQPLEAGSSLPNPEIKP